MPIEEDRLRSIRRQGPQHIPVSIWLLPATWKRHGAALEELAARHPVLFPPERREFRQMSEASGSYREGTHVDEWGCVWSNLHEGMAAIVTGHPIPRREDVRTFKPPAEITGNMPHGFMFLRLFDLRGFEEMMVDFAEEPPELQMLIDMVLQHNLKSLEVRLKTHRDPTMYFGDDNGMQTSLPISPAAWRKYIKPCYKQVFNRCKQAGIYVYFHTDGCIHEVIPDMIECGADVINPQFRANGLDNLVRTCKGKVCVDLDLDRQMLPFGTPDDIYRHVRQCVEALGDPAGGLWLLAECGPDVPLANIEAVCCALEEYRDWFNR